MSEDDVIDYRRRRAKETLEDAKRLFNTGSLISTVNRIYYAMFYMVSALLLTKNISLSKHSAVRALFNKEFVKTGEVSLEMGKFLSHMFEFRQKGDYGDFVEFEKEKVEEWLEMANKFIEEIAKVIEKSKA